jgi:hypothetical protein
MKKPARRRQRHAARYLGVGAMVMLALVLAASPALAQQPQDSSNEARRQEEVETERPNEIALVVAGTRDLDEEKTFFSPGLEYERRFGKQFGLVAEVEYQFDAGSWIAAAPFVVHPGRGLKLFAGPGFEHADNADGTEGEDPRDDVPDDGDSGATHVLLRFGGGYVIELAERYSIGPTVSVDFVHEGDGWARSVVLGVTFGMAF